MQKFLHFFSAFIVNEIPGRSVEFEFLKHPMYLGAPIQNMQNVTGFMLASR